MESFVPDRARDRKLVRGGRGHRASGFCARDDCDGDANQDRNDSRDRHRRHNLAQLFVTANGSTLVEIVTPLLPTFEFAGGRLRVAQRMDDGGKLRGWVPADQLMESEVGGGQGYGIGGSACGCPGYGGERRLRVAVSAGTAVFSKAGNGRWAAFTRAVELDAVESGSDWLRLERLSGVTETYSHPGSPCNDVRAFVRRSDVRVLPP